MTDQLEPDHTLRKHSAAILRLYGQYEPRIQAQHPTIQYSAILKKIYEQIASDCSLSETITSADKMASGARIGTWMSFRDAIETLQRLKRHFKLGPLDPLRELSRLCAGMQTVYSWVCSAALSINVSF